MNAKALVGLVIFATFALTGCTGTPEPTPTVTVTHETVTTYIRGGTGNVSTFLEYVREDSQGDFRNYNDGMILDMLDDACTMRADDYLKRWAKHDFDAVEAVLNASWDIGYLCSNVTDPWNKQVQ